MQLSSEKKLQLKFSTDISLTQRAYTTIISSLWNQKDVCVYIKNNLLARGRETKWTEIESLVLSSLEKIVIPEACKLILKSLIQLMGKQILHWISITKSAFQYFSDHIIKIKFFWNENGSFDYVKTANFVIEQDSAYKELCYCIACIFCIEEYLTKPVVRMALPSFYRSLCTCYFAADTYLVYVWTKKLNPINCNFEEDEVISICSDDIGYSVAEEFMCVPTMKYFLERYPPVEKKVKIKDTLRLIFSKTRPQVGNVLLFLFSYLHEKEVNEIIYTNTFAVLSCLLQFPHQEFFMSIANSTWNYLSEIQYLNLFLDIAEYVSEFHMSYVYKKVLTEFWLAPPSAFREYVIHKCISGSALSRLFLMGNTDDVVQIIFNECTPETRQQIIFHFEGMNICDFLMKVRRWESLKIFVLGCISSKDVLEEFILQYKNYRPSYRLKETEQNINIFIEKVKQWY